MKPNQFQSRLSALVAEAIQSRVLPAVVCSALKVNFDAVMEATKRAIAEQSARDLTETIVADQKSAVAVNPSRSST